MKRQGIFTEGNEGNQGMSEDKVLDKVLDKVAWGRIERGEQTGNLKAEGKNNGARKGREGGNRDKG
jgi:hypothetical protein